MAGINLLFHFDIIIVKLTSGLQHRKLNSEKVTIKVRRWTSYHMYVV